MDGSLPGDAGDVAFVTTRVPEAEAVVDLRGLDEAADSSQSDVIAYLALVHSEITELKSELRTLRQSVAKIVDLA